MYFNPKLSPGLVASSEAFQLKSGDKKGNIFYFCLLTKNEFEIIIDNRFPAF